MTPRQTLLNHRRALGCQKPSAPGRLANSTPILLCFMRTRLSSVFAGAPRELQIPVCGVAWEERAGSCSQPTGAGCVGKLRGSLLEGQDTNGPLFPTTWAQQARRVRRRGPTRQPEGPAVAGKAAPLWPVLGAQWERYEAAGNFPGGQHAPWCHSHEHSGHVAGSQMGSILGKGRRGTTGSRFA